MRFSTAVFAAFVGMAAAAPAKSKLIGSVSRRANSGYTQVRPGNEPIMEEENILKGTNKADETIIVQASDVRIAKASKSAVAASLNLSLVNNMGDGVNAYISGKDSDGKVVFVDGAGNLIYPASGGSPIPTPITDPIAIPLGALGQSTDIAIPISLESSRISFAVGELQFYTVATSNGEDLVQPSISNPEDPSSGLNWGFSEFTLTEDNVIWTNISYVDWVGMILSLDLAETDGNVITVIGLAGNAVPGVCEALAAQTAIDNQPWGATCMAGQDGAPLRILSPGNYRHTDESAWADYFTAYVDEVWNHYSTTPLTINTQNGELGSVDCTVNGDQLECAGDNRGYAKPTADDIYGCNSGPFGILEGDNPVHYAVVPRLCAAFHRGTLLLEGGNVQPGLHDQYYTTDPNNHYSRIIHEMEVDGKGYAFPYDDVNPDGPNEASGLVSSGKHERLTFYVGGKQAS
jgi:hypothetical protein